MVDGDCGWMIVCVEGILWCAVRIVVWIVVGVVGKM